MFDQMARAYFIGDSYFHDDIYKIWFGGMLGDSKSNLPQIGSLAIVLKTKFPEWPFLSSPFRDREGAVKNLSL